MSDYEKKPFEDMEAEDFAITTEAELDQKTSAGLIFYNAMGQAYIRVQKGEQSEQEAVSSVLSATLPAFRAVALREQTDIKEVITGLTRPIRLQVDFLTQLAEAMDAAADQLAEGTYHR